MMTTRNVCFSAAIALTVLFAACSGSDAEKEKASNANNETGAGAAIDPVNLAAQDADRAAEVAVAAQRVQTEKLRIAVEKEIISQNVRVKSFTLVHKSGNEYKGTLVAKQPVGELVFGEFTYSVDVIYDGETMVWDAGSGTQTACCEAMSAEEFEDLMKKMFEVASGINRMQKDAPPSANSQGVDSSSATASGLSTETGESPVNDLNSKLLSDLSRKDYIEVANEWSTLYDKLDERFKNTVHSGSKSYDMDYGDLYGLNKGFSWDLCGTYVESELGDVITREFGATGRSKAEEERGYRAGMVYFYVRNQLIDCW